jgi:hypothetical protein
MALGRARFLLGRSTAQRRDASVSEIHPNLHPGRSDGAGTRENGKVGCKHVNLAMANAVEAGGTAPSGELGSQR